MLQICRMVIKHFSASHTYVDPKIMFKAAEKGEQGKEQRHDLKNIFIKGSSKNNFCYISIEKPSCIAQLITRDTESSWNIYQYILIILLKSSYSLLKNR